MHTIIPKGALLTVTTGAYSDYTVSGVFRALQEIDSIALMDEWLTNHPEQWEEYAFDDKAFLASISYLLEPLECFEFHLTNYACFQDMYVEKIGE